MAAIWKGSLAFGLVNIPVELRTAVRADHISFRLLHEEDLSPVKYERVCQADGEPVPWNEIVKGYEYEKGKYVVMTDEDFKAAAIEGSKTIDIIDFVKEEEIDPRYFETPYYLVPAKNAEKSYALLREAIRSTGAVGIGKIIIRQTQHLAGIKVVGDALVVVEEVILDDVGLVAEAEDEVLVPVMGVELHQVPHDRPVADRHHGLGNVLAVIAEAKTLAAAEKNNFHGFSAFRVHSERRLAQ